MQEKEVLAILQTLGTLLQQFVPAVYSHFKEIGISLEVFAVDWFLTIYSRSFPLSFTCRIWDHFFLKGGNVKYLFQVAVGLIAYIADDLLLLDFEGCLHLLSKIPQIVEVERLFQLLGQFEISNSRWNKIISYDLKTVSVVLQK